MNKNVYTTKERGAALLIFVILFLFTSLSLVLTIAHGVYGDYVKYQSLFSSKESLYSAEAGIEDAIYRHRGGKNYSNTEQFTIMGTQASTTRTMNNGSYTIIAEGVKNGAVRKGVVKLDIGSGASFNFGLQSGNGGIFMENNSTVRGNVFANGSVRGANNNIVYGDIISAGSSGLARSVHATGSVWAHTIDNSIVDKDAYYTTKLATIVGGISYPSSPDQDTADMPLSDTQIEDWKLHAQAGGVIASTSPQCSSGTYTIGTDTTIGPVKIECNLLIQNNSTDVYLVDAVWVQGNIEIKNSPNVRVASTAPQKDVAIIADNPLDRHTNSQITLQNNVIFSGYGTSSYIFLISQNNSTEDGGNEYAINMKNNATGALALYAMHGEVLIENGSGIKAVTGYYIHTKNNTQIIYESGLIDTLFTSGPGGGYTITSWNAIE